MRAIDHKTGIGSLSLGQIEATVAAHLGPGRVPGQEQEPCFSRQISMYLAKHIGGWSTTKIGRFYNGRHYTTILHAIRKVERLRAADESVDALLEVLTAAPSPAMTDRSSESMESKWHSAIIEAITARVLDRLAQLSGTGNYPTKAVCNACGTTMSATRTGLVSSTSTLPFAVDACGHLSFWTLRGRAREGSGVDYNVE